MFLFSFLVTYRNPVILLPPFYGTNLYVTYNNTNLPWYCSKSENDSLLWLSTSYFGPLQMKCLFKLLTSFIDDDGHITNWPNTTISIHDFGGDEGSKFVIKTKHFKKGFGPSMRNFVQHFTDLGWQLRKDLFVAPFDWRIGPTFSDSFWPEFKNLIEDAYDVQKEKVTIVAFSQGGYMTHQFLTKHCTQDWKNNFISQVILISPSFAGDIQMLYNIWSKRIPTFPYVHSEAQDLCFEQMPSIHAHIPNEIVYEDVVLAYGPDGEEYKGKDLYRLIMDHLLHSNEIARKIFDKSQEIRKRRPLDLGVKTVLLMNSKRETAVALNFSNGWDKNPIRIIGEGDGTMPAYGHRWVCKNFKNITCIDFNSTSDKYDHYPLILTKRVLNVVSNITYYNTIPNLENDEGFVKDFDEL